MNKYDDQGSTVRVSRLSGLRSAAAAVAVIALLLLALTGCGTLAYDSDAGTPDVLTSEPAYSGMDLDQRAAEDSFEGEIGILPPPVDPGTGPDAAEVPADQRFIIRTVGVRVQVDDVEDAVESVRTEVERIGGIVTGLQVSTDEDIPVYRYDAGGSLADGAPLKGYVTVRVPVDALPGFLETVDELGTVLRQSSDESDVTQEHIDLSARLGNLNSQEERLREFFDRAENVEEMLEIERELGRVRGEIESLTARIAYLERQSAMATVTIELAGIPSVIRPQGSDWGFVRAITTGVRGFVNTINAMIIVAMSLLPLAVIGVVVWLVIRAVLRARRKRREVAEGPAPGAIDPGSDDPGVHE